MVCMSHVTEINFARSTFKTKLSLLSLVSYFFNMCSEPLFIYNKHNLLTKPFIIFAENEATTQLLGTGRKDNHVRGSKLIS